MLGKLNLFSAVRIPCEYTELAVTGRMCVQDVMREALDNFGLDGSTWNRYNLIEVSLEKGVGERTVNPQEEMLQLVRNLRKVGPSIWSCSDTKTVPGLTEALPCCPLLHPREGGPPRYLGL